MSHQFTFNPYILDNLPVPAAGFDVVQDSAEPRLRMYITNRGVKSFFVRRRINKKDCRIIIGKYPDTTIEVARARVSEFLAKPQNKKIIQRKKTGFRKIADLYLIKHVHRNEASRAKLVRSMVLHLEPLFSKNVQDITPDDIIIVIDKISGAPSFNRMLQLLSSIFEFAKMGGYITQNPAEKVQKRKEVRRSRPLNKIGFDRLLSAIKKEKSQNLRAAFLMLIVGFDTKSKIFSMRWRDLDFNNYMWGAKPLSDSAAVLLQNLPQEGKWVFTGKHGRHLTDPRRGWKKITKTAKIPNLTMDDVNKYLNKQLVWSSNKEDYRKNMNDLLLNINV